MNDLEARLRADADNYGDAPAPKLDVALDRAFASRPRRRRTWLIAAACAVVLAGTAISGYVVGRISHDASPSMSIAPAPLTLSLVGATVTARDDHSLIVFAAIDGSDDNCTTVVPAQVVSQNGSVVAIALTPAFQAGWPSSPGHPECGDNLVWKGPTDSVAPIANIGYLHLDDALGSRTLVDATTRQILPVIDAAKLPTPRYLPDGFAPNSYQVESAYSTMWVVGRKAPTYQVPTFATGAGFMAAPFATRGYNGPVGLRVAVATTTSGVTSSSGAALVSVLGHATVEGRRAVITDASLVECVTWQAEPHLAVQVCTWPENVYTTVGQSPPPGSRLSTAQLLRVARSLH